MVTRIMVPRSGSAYVAVRIGAAWCSKRRGPVVPGGTVFAGPPSTFEGAPGLAEPADELSERRIGPVALGHDRPPVRRGQLIGGRPGDADRGIVPGEPELVGAVVLVGHQVQHRE